MDAGRFDALSKALAGRRSRRRLGAGGLAAGVLAALGAAHADAAASTTCALAISGLLSSGPTAGGSVDGSLSLTLTADGTIDQASFITDGQTMPAVGRAVGRELSLLINLGDGTRLVLTGVGQQPIAACQGVIAGLVGGPKPGDVGSWTASLAAANAGDGGGSTSGGSGATTGGNASGGNGGSGATTSEGNASNTGNASAGNASGNASDGTGSSNAIGDGNASGNASDGNASDGGGTTDCQGVACGSVCCAAFAGLNADRDIACNAVNNTCLCVYSCAGAGCPNSGDGFLSAPCDVDPRAQCDTICPAGPVFHEHCTNGTINCGDDQNVRCVDVASDAQNCGACGHACPSGVPCVNGACTCTDGRFPCPGVGCVNLQTDVQNCGACGHSCAGRTPLGQCAVGVCF